MKTLIVFLALLIAAPLARAEDRAAAGPERTIQEFYHWYVGALLANQDPLNKRRAELRRFASDRLLREIDHTRTGPDGLDGDPFVDTQDFDRDWGKQLSVSKVAIHGARATAFVELKGREMGNRKLDLGLVQERGGWKVDRVKAQ